MATQPPLNEGLVNVFDTDQESEAMAVRGLLESAGIEVAEISLDAPQDVLPGVGGVILQVPEEQADDARAIIEDFRRNPLQEDEAVSGDENP